MIGIVISGHGTFPNGMYESAQLITGEMANVKVIPFKEDNVKLEKDIEAAITELNTGKGVVCFTDLAGGTPFNVSSKIAANIDNVRVLGGTNLPMLLTGLFQRNEDLDAFIDIVMSEGRESIKAFKIKEREQTDASDGI